MDKFISMWKVREIADKVLVNKIKCQKIISSLRETHFYI